MHSQIQNKPKKFRFKQNVFSNLKCKKEITIMVMSHLKTQIVQISLKYQKVLILILIKLKVSTAKVSVLIFKNMKLMKTIFKMKSLQSTLYKKLRRLEKNMSLQ